MRTTDYTTWRQTVALALSSNPENKFSRKRPALANKILHSSFPDQKILRYYTHPVISPEQEIRDFKPEWTPPDIKLLAELCKELFNWDSKWGMCKFMRCITPGLVIWNLVNDTTIPIPHPPPSQTPPTPSDPTTKSPIERGKNVTQSKTINDFFKSTKTQAPQPRPIVQHPSHHNSQILGIHAYRTHPSTDFTPELRISYLPSQIYPYQPLTFNLTSTVPPTSHLAPPSPTKHSSSSSASTTDTDDDLDDETGPKEMKWSPDEVQRMWIPKPYLLKKFAGMVDNFDRAKEEKKRSPRKKANKGGMNPGAMDLFVRPTSPHHINTVTVDSTIRLENVESSRKTDVKVTGESSSRPAGSKKSPSTKRTSSPIQKRTPGRKTNSEKYTSPSKLPDLPPFTIGRTPQRRHTDDDVIAIPSPTPTPQKPPRGHASPSPLSTYTPHRISPVMVGKPFPSPMATPMVSRNVKGSTRKEVISILSSSPESPESVGRRRGGEEGSGEESDELPSPRRLLQFLKTPRKENEKPSAKEDRKKGGGGFRESFGGTLHEVDE